MSYEVEAWACLNGGDNVEVKVTVPEDATDEQIDEAVKQAVMNHLDWGWEDPYDYPIDTYPCGCCMCCGCDCYWDYDEDEDWEDD